MVRLHSNVAAMATHEAEPLEGDRKRRCVQALSAPDAVMDVNVQKEVGTFMQLTQDPAELIKMLSSNYQGFAVMTNLLQDWLQVAGDSEADVRQIVQAKVKKQVMESFNAEVSDAFFFSTEVCFVRPSVPPTQHVRTLARERGCVRACLRRVPTWD